MHADVFMLIRAILMTLHRTTILTTQADYVDLADKICDETAPEGTWLKENRLKATGTEIKMVGDPNKLDCGVDCQTLALACRETYGDYSLDLAEKLWNGAKRAELANEGCYELSNACSSKPPPVPETHKRFKEQKKAAKKSKKKGKKSKKGKKAVASKDEL